MLGIQWRSAPRCIVGVTVCATSPLHKATLSSQSEPAGWIKLLSFRRVYLHSFSLLTPLSTLNQQTHRTRENKLRQLELTGNG